ncbi:MAG: addiction module protein [Planctomycetia bacterium]
MNGSMRELGIDRLTREQRIALALEIWESLGDDRPTGLRADQRAELARRDAELDAEPGKALTWDQIRASVESRR